MRPDLTTVPLLTALVVAAFAACGDEIPHCRCVQTAERMGFGPAIEQSQDLTYFVYDEANRCTKTLALLAEEPSAGTNTALVSHAGFTCPPLDGLAWGEAAIYKPDGQGGATFLARVTWDQWANLP